MTTVTARSGLDRGAATWLMYGGLGYLNYLVSAIGPALPLLRDELGTSYTVSSLHFTAFAAGLVASGLLTDRVTARLGRRVTFWAGVAGVAAGGLVVAVGTNPAGTIGGTLITGLFGGALLSMTSAVLSELHGERRATALVEGNVVASGAGIAAPLLVGWLAAAVNWRPAFALPAVLGVAAVLWLRGVPLPQPAAAGPATRPDRRLPPAFWLFWVALFLADCIEFSMAAWGPTYLRDTAGFSATSAAAAASLFLVGMLAGRVAGSRLLVAGRQPGTVLTLALVTTAVGFGLFRLGTADPLVLGGLLLTGLGVANLWPLTLSFALGAAGGATDVASARASLAAGAGILAAPFTLGAAADRLGIGTAYWLVPLLVLAAFLTTAVAHAVERRSR